MNYGKSRHNEAMFRDGGLRDRKDPPADDLDAARGITWTAGVGIAIWAVLMILIVNQCAAGAV